MFRHCGGEVLMSEMPVLRARDIAEVKELLRLR